MTPVDPSPEYFRMFKSCFDTRCNSVYRQEHSTRYVEGSGSFHDLKKSMIHGAIRQIKTSRPRIFSLTIIL